MDINQSLKFVLGCAEFASYILIFWEHLLTCNKEISLVWAREDRWSLSITIFAFTRYFALAWSIIGIAMNGSGGITKSICTGWEHWQYWSTFAQMISVQVILMLRVYATWARYLSLSILYFVIPLWLLQVAAGVTFLALSLPKATVCLQPPVHSYIVAHWAIIAAFEFTLLLLLCWKEMESKLAIIRTDPWHWLIKSSSLFFVIILATHLVTVISWVVNPAFGTVLRPVVFALTTATGNRLLLELRQLYHTTPCSPLIMDKSPLGPLYPDASRNSAVHSRYLFRSSGKMIISFTRSLLATGSRLLLELHDSFSRVSSHRKPPHLQVMVFVEEHRDTSPIAPIAPSPSGSMFVTLKRSFSQLRFTPSSPTYCNRDDSALSPTSRCTESLGSTLSVLEIPYPESIYRIP